MYIYIVQILFTDSYNFVQYTHYTEYSVQYKDRKASWPVYSVKCNFLFIAPNSHLLPALNSFRPITIMCIPIPVQNVNLFALLHFLFCFLFVPFFPLLFSSRFVECQICANVKRLQYTSSSSSFSSGQCVLQCCVVCGLWSVCSACSGWCIQIVIKK